MKDLIKGIFDERELLQIELESFLDGEPQLCDSIKNTPVEIAASNMETVEGRCKVAARIVERYNALVANGAIGPESYMGDIGFVRDAGVDYANCLMVFYARSLDCDLARVIDIARQAKEEGRLNITDAITPQASETEQGKIIDSIVTLDGRVRVLRGSGFLEEANKADVKVYYVD